MRDARSKEREISAEEKAMHEAWANAQPQPVGWPVFLSIWRAARDFYRAEGAWPGEDNQTEREP